MRLLKPVALATLLGQLTPAMAIAQAAGKAQPPSQSATLTLEEAIALARQNNPTFLQTKTAKNLADAQLRSAYGGLLPSSNVSFGTRYQQGGQQFIQGAQLGVNSDQLQANYSLSLFYQLNGSTLMSPRAAKASREAAEADVTGAAETLRAGITQQYITVLRAIATAALQDTLVLTQRGNLDLAKARVAVGADNILAVRRAEVALGQAEVQALTAHNTAEIEKVRLFQQIGLQPREDVVLTTTFAVAKPNFSLDSVLGLAQRVNPAVYAARERERASGWNVRMAQSLYTPTLSIATGWGGNSYRFTNSEVPVIGAIQNLAEAQRFCYTQDSIRSRLNMPLIGPCDGAAYQLSAAQAQTLRDKNSNRFPFQFTRNPLSVSASLSIPVFDNFNREERIEQAQVARDNARLNVRARELQTTADVTQTYLNLVTAARTVELQEVNAQRAREELSYAQERYRVGAATFLDVTTSNATFVQAQVDRINAIYDYHRAFAGLEAAVGRPLR
jgi:outer membrane protein